MMDNVEFKVCALDNIRQIKTQEELKCIAEACRISDEGFKKTIPYIKPGVTERELMAVLESSMLLEGSEGNHLIRLLLLAIEERIRTVQQQIK